MTEAIGHDSTHADDVGSAASGNTEYATIKDIVSEWSETESWRQVPCFPSYAVSTFGNIRRVGTGRILKPTVIARYCVVSLSEAGVIRNVRIHIMVARAFLGEPSFEGSLVAHNDGNSLNNNVGNLRWASAVDNQRDRIRHRTHICGSAVSGAKLFEADIPTIRRRATSGERYASIAEDFGVSISTISLIKRRRIWRNAHGANWRLAS